VRLAPLLPALTRIEALTEAHTVLDTQGHVTLGVIDAAKAVSTALLWRRRRGPVLLVVPRETDAEAFVEQLRAWAGDAAWHFPARGTLPYGREAPTREVTARRLAVLSRLARPGEYGSAPPLIVTSVGALAERTLRPADLGRGPGALAPGGHYTIEAMARALVGAGYDFEPLVDAPGQAARRGGLLDVFPPDRERPLRIEFFGDVIESIREFDPETQRTIERIAGVSIGPAGEWFPEAGDLRLLAFHLREAEGDEAEADRGQLQQGLLPAPHLYGPLVARATLLDHLPHGRAQGRGSLIVLDEREAVEAAASDLDTLARERREELAARQLFDGDTPLPHLPQAALVGAIEAHRPRVLLSRWATGREPHTVRLPFQSHDAYAGRLPAAAEEVRRRLLRGDHVVTVTQQAQRYREVLSEQGIAADVTDSIETALPGGTLALVQGSLPEGWQVATLGGTVALATDRELFGFVKQRRALRREGSHRSKFLAEVTPGDFVVHADHGIARFVGIVRRPVDGQDRDYLELRFAAEDRLYVPVTQVDRVTRYVGPSGQSPRLTRLGTQEWNRTRARVRAAVAVVAADLLRLYAARQLLPGHAFGPDTTWQHEMEAAFPYQETDDQLRALTEVKDDLESARPMDRIVCGDVGFGKTEVAIRAAFKAVQEGLQVAMLVPTTVLAQQHDRTFRERLASFPVRIEVLSRFRTDEEIRVALAGIRSGEVDIVIGTHRLLQDDVEFANLGLVVIDEEQRFGVAHKERLKRMRLEVDVLTLSATPIPRTLHMALAGIRDMSMISSAPVDRQPVVTYVAEWDDALVREAILHEMDRGGQVYVVHNRVQSIDECADNIRALVPDARVVTGHGQMPERLLERVMDRFSGGDFDVLVCTTIIESGIDIPNVNTLIVDLADRFGLAQLYQLRGRVGRSVHQAYAYLFHARGRILTEVAQQRLAAIFEANELGAGFQVALRDLEIRGAGNLLGAEQSGQIASVGFDLYTQMLAEAVEELKGAEQRRTEPVLAVPAPTPLSPRGISIDLPVASYVPESYLPEIEARIALYQRVAALQRFEDADTLLAETRDRAGEPPEPVLNLLALVRLRLAAAAARIESVRLDGDEVVLTAAGRNGLAGRRLGVLPRAVRQVHNQLRLPRAALGERWLEAIEALLRMLAANDGGTGGSGTTAREPAAAR